MNTNSCDAVKTPRQTRKIKPTRRSVSGVFSFKEEKSIPFESTLERDFLLRRGYGHSVLDIIPQPVQIPFQASNGRSYHYTPDFLVYYRVNRHPWATGPKPLLVEVKHRADLIEGWQDMKAKFKAATRYARERGWEFRIHDERRIRDVTLDNIKLLQRYKRMAFCPEESQWILNNVKAMGQAPFQYLVGRHFFDSADRAIGVSHLWHLLAIGALECDITLPLNNHTTLWIPHHG